MEDLKLFRVTRPTEFPDTLLVLAYSQTHAVNIANAKCGHINDSIASEIGMKRARVLCGEGLL